MSIDEATKLIWDYHLLNQKLEKADAILVLGSHDTRVAEHGAQLYLDGWAPLVVMSGGAGRLTTGLWNTSEAEKFASIARGMGVPASSILIEDTSTNTGENIQFSRKLLEEKGVESKKLIVVQKPYMERRTYATCMKQWPEMDFIVSSPPIALENYPNEHVSKEDMIHIMVGDLQRIKEYPARGFQIEQEIPTGVWEAYEYLIKQGFNKHQIK